MKEPTMDEPKRTTHEDGDLRWYYHGLLTDEDIEEYVAEKEKPNSGQPYFWCDRRCVGDCDTCEGRMPSDPPPHSWEDTWK